MSLFLRKNFSCPYFGASHIGHPPIFWKQFVLDTALKILENYEIYIKLYKKSKKIKCEHNSARCTNENRYEII